MAYGILVGVSGRGEDAERRRVKKSGIKITSTERNGFP